MLSVFLLVLAASVTYYNYPNVDPKQRVVSLPTAQIGEEHDFVIVGGGSAGCVLANRLTEVPSWDVLLLEAGGEETVLSDTPLFAGLLWGTPLNWNYSTVPQKHACLSTGGICPWPRGRVIGGSSTLNFMVYVRGNRRDYDGWAALGNPGWSYDEVLPYFRLSEDNRNPSYASNAQYHGTGGYQTVTESEYHSPLANLYLEGGKEMGFPTRDLNAEFQTGFMTLQGTLRNGSRCSTAKSFLRPVRNRPNLNVAERAFVIKIIFNGTKAVGVTYVRDNREYNVYARKEVIISAGAINSPQLLMLSGIGPRKDLSSLGIKTVRNLPVGYNLNDHYGAPVIFQTQPGFSISPSTFRNIETIVEYSQPFGRGQLTSPSGIDVIAFLNSTYVAPNLDYPDIEIHFTSYYPFLNSSVWFGLALITHPWSRGRIILNSSNPFDYPIINPNYFSTEHDLNIVKQGFKYVLKVGQTSALKQANSTFFKDFYTICGNRTGDDFITCAVQGYTTTIFHPSGTCRMGLKKDPNAVVDNELRVHGVSSLRVIDASVMPFVTGGNTNGPTIMIAERAADFIKTSYNQTPRITH